MPRATPAGKAVIRFTADMKGLEAGMRRVSRRMRQFGAQMQSVGSGLFRLGAVAAAPFGIAIKAAAENEIVMRKFNKVFSESHDLVEAWANKFSEAAQMSQTDAKKMLAAAGDLFKPLGFSEQQAAEMAKQMVQLAADLAAFNNKKPDETFNDLASAITGATRPMKKYGVIISQVAMKAELLKMGMDPKNATEQQKALARLNIIMAGSKDALGATARQANTFAGMMRSLKKTVDDFANDVGDLLLPIVKDWLKQGKSWLNSSIEWIKQNKQLIPQFATMAVKIAAIGAALMALGKASSVLSGLFSPTGIIMLGAVALVSLAESVGLVDVGLNKMATTLAHGFKVGGIPLDDWAELMAAKFNKMAAALTLNFDRMKDYDRLVDEILRRNARGPVEFMNTDELDKKWRKQQEEFDRMNERSKRAFQENQAYLEKLDANVKTAITRIRLYVAIEGPRAWTRFFDAIREGVADSKKQFAKFGSFISVFEKKVSSLADKFSSVGSTIVDKVKPAVDKFFESAKRQAQAVVTSSAANPIDDTLAAQIAATGVRGTFSAAAAGIVGSGTDALSSISQNTELTARNTKIIAENTEETSVPVV